MAARRWGLRSGWSLIGTLVPFAGAWAAPAAAPASSPAAGAARVALLKPVADELSAAVSVATSVVLAVGLLLVAAMVVKAWRARSLIVEPFDVPKELADQGLGGVVMSQMLFDALVELQRSARPDDGPADISFLELSRQQVDLQLPGTTWSVRAAIRFFTQALGRPERRLAGEVYRIGEAFGIRLRSSERGAVDVPLRFHDAADLGRALRDAAQCALVLTDPLAAAGILMSIESPASGYPRTVAALRAHLAGSPAEQHQDA